jgi:hypothetical protein
MVPSLAGMAGLTFRVRQALTSFVKQHALHSADRKLCARQRTTHAHRRPQLHPAREQRRGLSAAPLAGHAAPAGRQRACKARSRDTARSTTVTTAAAAVLARAGVSEHVASAARLCRPSPQRWLRGPIRRMAQGCSAKPASAAQQASKARKASSRLGLTRHRRGRRRHPWSCLRAGSVVAPVVAACLLAAAAWLVEWQRGVAAGVATDAAAST